MVFHHKLVRDNIPDIIKREGGQCEIEHYNNEEMRRAVWNKIREEVDELLIEDEPVKILLEVADVIEAVTAYAKTHGFNIRDVEKAVKERRITRGGFDKQIMLVWCTDNRK